MSVVWRVSGSLRLLAATVVLLGLLVALPFASFGARRSAERRLPFTSLLSVSCVAGGWCAAVGSYTPKGAGEPISLAERSNGRDWALRSTQSPRGAFSSELSAVSCTSRRSCVAVGDYQVGTDCRDGTTPCSTQPFTNVWNGRVWTLEGVPLPAYSHMRQVFAKLDVNSRVDLTRLATERVSEPPTEDRRSSRTP